nr:hypothetical protein [Tanacetum cinerariifolium]
MQHTISELTALCTSLQRQHSKLLAKFQAQEVEILRLKERVQVLEDREGGIDVPTGSGSIPTVGPPATVISTDSEVGPTAKSTEKANDQGAEEGILYGYDQKQLRVEGKRFQRVEIIRSKWSASCDYQRQEIFMLVEKDYPLRKVKVVATVRRIEMPLPEVCTDIEEKNKKLPVKDRWQLH